MKKNTCLLLRVLIGLLFYFVSCKPKVPGNTGRVTITTPSPDTVGKTNRGWPAGAVPSPKSPLLLALFHPDSINQAHEAVWVPAKNETDSFPVSADGKCYTRADTILYYKATTGAVFQPFALVIFGTYKKQEDGSYDDCHACSPLMSYALLQQTGKQQWTVLRFVKKFIYSGAWGQLFKPGLLQYGKNKFALDLSGGGSGQGYFEYGLTYYDVETGNYIYTREPETISNEGAVVSHSASFSYQLAGVFIPSDSLYWDLQVLSKGRIPVKEGGVAVPARITETFRFNSSKNVYEQVSVHRENFARSGK